MLSCVMCVFYRATRKLSRVHLPFTIYHSRFTNEAGIGFTATYATHTNVRIWGPPPRGGDLRFLIHDFRLGSGIWDLGFGNLTVNYANHTNVRIWGPPPQGGDLGFLISNF